MLQLGLDAGEVLAFENSINGIRASRAAGPKTIINCNGYTEHDDFSGAERVLDRLVDEEQPSRVMQQKYGQDFLTIEKT